MFFFNCGSLTLFDCVCVLLVQIGAAAVSANDAFKSLTSLRDGTHQRIQSEKNMKMKRQTMREAHRRNTFMTGKEGSLQLLMKAMQEKKDIEELRQFDNVNVVEVEEEEQDEEQKE